MASKPGDQTRNTDQIFADWLRDYAATLGATRGILRVRRAEPRFAYHNYFARFKVEVADFDGTGQNPANVTCQVVEVSVTDQAASAVLTACDTIKDL
jgi:hypothetical protein